MIEIESKYIEALVIIIGVVILPVVTIIGLMMYVEWDCKRAFKKARRKEIDEINKNRVYPIPYDI